MAHRLLSPSYFTLKHTRKTFIIHKLTLKVSFSNPPSIKVNQFNPRLYKNHTIKSTRIFFLLYLLFIYLFEMRFHCEVQTGLELTW